MCFQEPTASIIHRKLHEFYAYMISCQIPVRCEDSPSDAPACHSPKYIYLIWVSTRMVKEGDPSMLFQRTMTICIEIFLMTLVGTQSNGPSNLTGYSPPGHAPISVEGCTDILHIQATMDDGVHYNTD